MSIITIDNFQVNISNPIDNRFVVGSQSIPSGPNPVYPTPFYKYKEDIVYKYPGLRIWDFNENVPYFWNGTAWINENTTGAIVENAATGNTGFVNYLAKFKNNTTLLTWSKIYDTGSNIGIGLTGSAIVPGSVLPGFAPVPGLHVAGNIKTNNRFVGNGSQITQINATNITTGSLNLQRITWPPATPPLGGIYILKNTNGSGSGTSWDLVSNIVPIPGAFNLLNTTSATNLTVGDISAGLNLGNNRYEFKPIISQGLLISPGSNNVRIESRAGVNLGVGSASVYAGLSSNLHQFRSLKSTNLVITQDSDLVNINANIISDTLNITPIQDGIGVRIEVPATFEGAEIYVNGLYYGAEQLGTRSKPYKTLKAAINKILNRSSNLSGSLHRITYTYVDSGITYTLDGIGPTDTFKSTINGGNAFNKWDPRNPVKVIIQTYCRVTENLAINNVTYFLESETNSALAVEQTDFNSEWIIDNPPNLEWVIDMKELSDNAPRVTTVGDPRRGELINSLSCRLEGSGRVYFSGTHLKRKGFFRSYATNGYDFEGKSGNGPVGSRLPQNGSQLFIGNIGGSLKLEMYPLIRGGSGEPIFPATPGQAGSHISEKIALTGPKVPSDNDADTYHLDRENTLMYGYKVVSEPDYGCIQTEGRNFPYSESLFLEGIITINAQEQHMMYFKDYGTGYSEGARIYMRRQYQNVLIDNVTTPFKYVRLEAGISAINDFNAGDYLIITNLGNFTNWSSIAVANSFRDINGQFISGSPQVGWAFKWNGTGGTTFATSTSRVARCSKQYLPCKYVYDIYLKNGARFNHGGDFYTQQNTGANQGGPDSFACLRNDFDDTGSLTTTWYPSENNRSTTFCQFRATGGGFVTNLIYNHYIKTITNTNFLIYRNHDILFRNIKIDSHAYSSILSALDTNGTPWNKTHGFGVFYNCLFGDFTIPNSGIRTTISNQTVWANNESTVSGKMILGGSRIELTNAVLDVITKDFYNSVNLVTTPGEVLAAAIASGLSSGCLYKDDTVIKVIP